MKKKIFTLIMGLLLTALGAAAQNSGNLTPSLQWNYNAGTKTLTITGTGAMPDYTAYGDQPWVAFREQIKSVTIENGVTKIGSCAFFFCEALQSIALPAALSKIGDYAFNRCTALTVFEVDPGNAHFTATDGVLYNKAKTSQAKK